MGSDCSPDDPVVFPEDPPGFSVFPPSWYSWHLTESVLIIMLVSTILLSTPACLMCGPWGSLYTALGHFNSLRHNDPLMSRPRYWPAGLYIFCTSSCFLLLLILYFYVGLTSSKSRHGRAGDWGRQWPNAKINLYPVRLSNSPLLHLLYRWCSYQEEDYPDKQTITSPLKYFLLPVHTEKSPGVHKSSRPKTTWQ